MAVDPAISLNVNPPQQMDISKLSDLVQMSKQRKQQNALKQLLSDPTNLDPSTGLPTSAAIQKIMSIDPGTGLKLAESSADVQQRIATGRQKQAESDAGILKDYRDSFANTAGPLIEKVGLEEATKQLRAQWVDTVKEASSAGISDEAKKKLQGMELTPALLQRIVSGSISPEKRADLAERDKSTAAATAREKETEKHDREMEGIAVGKANTAANAAASKGWTLFQDESGGAYRSNASTGKTQKMGDDGEWMEVDKLPTGLRKPGSAGQPKFDDKMGNLMAALAEQGVALPTGFRSKEQQVALYKGILERNPDLTPDEIATKLKTGQIEFGAQKKETQTAAGVAGKVEVAQNEIEEFVPLVRDASKAVKRGKFVPINKLVQMTDESLSDPDLKQLKAYINSTLNAYDMLAARGGTDAEKRKENRALLLSAESPEALEAGLKAFEKEAAAAHRAAVKATKVPELPSEKGEAKPDAAPKKFKYDAQGNLVPQ